MSAELVNMQTEMFVAGVVLGALLLLGGVAMGIWIGRQMRQHESESGNAIDSSRLFTALSQLASGVADDVSHHQQVMQQFASQLKAMRGDDAHDNVAETVNLLTEITKANQLLQQRLDEAEGALQRQAEEVSAHISAARTDPLTELPNRRALDDRLQQCLGDFQSSQVPFSILLLDVDHFKTLNDRYGHLLGDTVLSEISRTLVETVCPMGEVTRFGGDEFVIVLPETPIDQARDVAKSVREVIDLLTVEFEQESLKLSVSCGTAQFEAGEALEDLMQRADEALYAAKEAGRNAAYWHDGHQAHAVQGSASYTRQQLPKNLSKACNNLRQRLLEVAGESSHS